MERSVAYFTLHSQSHNIPSECLLSVKAAAYFSSFILSRSLVGVLEVCVSVKEPQLEDGAELTPLHTRSECSGVIFSVANHFL